MYKAGKTETGHWKPQRFMMMHFARRKKSSGERQSVCIYWGAHGCNSIAVIIFLSSFIFRHCRISRHPLTRRLWQHYLLRNTLNYGIKGWRSPSTVISWKKHQLCNKCPASLSCSNGPSMTALIGNVDSISKNSLHYRSLRNFCSFSVNSQKIRRRFVPRHRNEGSRDIYLGKFGKGNPYADVI